MNARNWDRDDPAAAYIPYTAHVTDSIISLENGQVMAMLALDGIAHQSANADSIDGLHKSLNGLWQNIAGPDVAVWTHIIRRRLDVYPAGDQPAGFAKAFDRKYKAMMKDQELMGNELFVSIVVRPVGAKWAKTLDAAEQLERRIKRLTDLLRNCTTSLAAYGARLLGLYEHRGQLYSEPLEMLAYLINGQRQRVMAPRKRISEMLCTSRNVFFKDIVEQRKVSGITYQAFIGIKEYASGTETGMLNALLTCPFELVLSQSLAFLSRAAAVDLMQKHRRRMVNAGDLAESQIQEIDEALDEISSGKYAMGDHQLSLAIKSEDLKELENRAGEVWSVFQDAAPGVLLAREDMALEAAFWAQLPGNFKYRPRPAPVSTRNFVGFSSFHNYPTGRMTGNQWGPAVMMLGSVAGSPYFLNFHTPIDRERYGETGDPDAGSSQRVPGSTTIIGPTGSGKTVAMGSFLTLAEKFGGPRVVFDKDRGLEILIRALGGSYFALRSGQPTGFNPFRRPDSAGWRQFLNRLVKKLVSDSVGMNIERERDIVAAVDQVMTELDPEYRSLTAVKQTLTDSEAIDALEKWTGHGEFGWVFDNPEDELDLTKGRVFGFDVTEFLKVPEVRTPLVMYILERMDQLIGEGRFICMMDEFANLLRDPEFDKPVQDLLETIRKRDGLLILACQSPTQVHESRIKAAVMEQCHTKVFFPNPSANKEHLREFGLSEREIDLITEADEMPEKSGRFLVKQGRSSVIAELDLRGFSDELAVISGTQENVAILERVMAETGPDGDWLREFYKQRV